MHAKIELSKAGTQKLAPFFEQYSKIAKYHARMLVWSIHAKIELF